MVFKKRIWRISTFKPFEAILYKDARQLLWCSAKYESYQTDCFATSYKSALRIWLFQPDFSKSQTSTAAILPSCLDTILHDSDKGQIFSEKHCYYFHCPKNVLHSILRFVFWIFPPLDTAVQKFQNLVFRIVFGTFCGQWEK